MIYVGNARLVVPGVEGGGLDAREPSCTDGLLLDPSVAFGVGGISVGTDDAVVGGSVEEDVRLRLRYDR